LANPDLLHRFKNGLELNTPDFDTFYTPGEKGYTDYPFAD
jgi:N-ethylmaleimide reductase